ncbi:MAG: glycosyltransferase family 4 protein [Nonlabens sp.]
MKNPSKKHNILLVGPLPDPITGISLANQIVEKGLRESAGFNISAVDTSYSSFDEKLGKFSFKKALYYLGVQLKSFKVLNVDTLYITPGQTFLGMLKYAPFIWLASMTGKQIVQHLNGNFLGRQYHMLTGWRKKLFHNLIARTDKAIVLSDSLRKNYSHLLKSDQIFTLANCVEDELFVDMSQLQNKVFSGLRIVYLSNLMLEKGIFDLLEALTILEARGVTYTAKIAGNIAPENKEQAHNYFKQLKYTEYIGVVDLAAKKELLLWSNVFVLPTYYTMEGQPFSILEAMATANAIITTAHAGIPDVFVEQENGLYVEKNKPESIVAVFERLAVDTKTIESMAFNNAAEARKKYTVKSFINQLAKILNE